MAFILTTALLLDIWLGEPRRWHPLVGFGRVAHILESGLRCGSFGLKWAGLLGWLLLVLPLPAVLFWLLAQLPLWLNLVMQGVVLYLCLGGRSLVQHARAVSKPLLTNDLPAARQAVAMIVSRDTEQMDESAVVRSTVESVLENGSDAQFAAIFWFVVAGAPGALLYRLANTLDAMWGYRNERYRDFGYAAAKLDDVLNWAPARLCALSYGLMGNLPLALSCWRKQAPLMDSPNGGPVMAAGAGALGVQLGGKAIYGGQIKVRPVLGSGRVVQVGDIERAIKLFVQTTLLWWATAVVAHLMVW